MHMGSRHLCAFLPVAKSIPYQWLWDKHCCIQDSSHVTLTSWHSKLLILDDVGFLCLQHYVVIWWFKFSNAYYFFICEQKHCVSMHCHSWNKRNILVTEFVGFVEIFIFLPFLFPYFHVRTKEGTFLMACEKKNQSLIFSDDSKTPALGSTAPQGNSASLIFHWNPQVGILLSSLNISDGFYLSLMTPKVILFC